MTQLLLAEGCDDLYENGKIVTLGDFACGTGGMLSEGYRMIKELNDSTMVNLYGQDNNGWYEAIALAEMIIKGQNPDNVKLVTSTLTTDAFPNQKMRLILMNPPFGLSYSKKEIGDEEYSKIVSHNKRNDWYEGGLPQTGDSQTLFWQFALSKLDDTKGRAAIICNASPLFCGTESKIRKWLMENDYIEAIVQFCPDLFYNTGITIYSLILNKNKTGKRKNKIQLIDASKICERMLRGLGFKRNRISETEDNNQIAKIVKIYSDFKKCSECKILTKEDFYYHEIEINRPFKRNFAITESRIKNLYACTAFNKLYDEDKYNELADLPARTTEQNKLMKEMLNGKEMQDYILDSLKNNTSDYLYKNKNDFEKKIKLILSKINPTEMKTLFKGIVLSLSKFDETADMVLDKHGKPEPDSNLKDTDLVPFKDDIDKYFKEEILRFVPTAWMTPYVPGDNVLLDDKVKCEINFNRFFYKYEKPESTSLIMKRLNDLNDKEKSLEGLLNGRK